MSRIEEYIPIDREEVAGLRKPQNILFVLPDLKQGGSEKVVYNLISKLDRLLFRSKIAWFHDKKYAPFDTLQDVPMFFIDKKPGFDLKAIHYVSHIIEKEKIDIINPHHFMPLFYSFYGSKIRHQRKLVYTEHSVWEAERLSGVWKRIGKAMFACSDVVIGVSPEVTEYLREKYGLSTHKALSIVNGIDTEFFTPGPKNGPLRYKLGFDESHILIGMVGNFRRVKNHEFLVRSFGRIAAEFSNVRLVLVGQGFPDDPEGTEKEIKKLVQEMELSDQVRLLGYRKDVLDILQILDIFCLTSYREGLPLSAIEAMAAGLPVVGTQTDGIRVVVNPGRNGFLVTVNDEEELANALESLVSNQALRIEMGNAAREDAEKFFGLSRCADEYKHLFSSLS